MAKKSKQSSPNISGPKMSGRMISAPAKRHYPKPVNIPFRPKSSSVESLWEYAVKHLADIHQGSDAIFEANAHNQWANICFGYPGQSSDERSEKMSKIKDQYRAYFKRGKGFKYAFDIPLILRDFPHFFEGDFKPQAPKYSIDGMISAVQTEIELSKQPNNRLKYKVSQINVIDEAKHIYNLQLDLGDDDMPSFYEGIKLDLLVNDTFYHCEGIDDDINEETLVVAANRKIWGRSGKIFLDTSFILQAVIDKLQKLKEIGFQPGQPGLKFIPDKTRELSVIPETPAPYMPIVEKMDDSQRQAHDAAVKNDLCFIWGPPGTGKSFTLAGLINTFYRDSQSTLVCCISNVAVDQLLNKTLDVIHDLGVYPNPGEILRAGNTSDERLLATDYLFPRDWETDGLRKRIQKLNEQISTTSKDPRSSTRDRRLALLKQERIDLREALKKKTESLILGSDIVFSTTAYYLWFIRLSA